MADQTRWSGLTHPSAAEYAARFDALQATGQNVHGEADFVATLVAPPARILDAGCGTGRVAIRLAALGFRCVGVDADPQMLAVAISAGGDEVDWLEGDIADRGTWSPADPSATFDVVVAAGNVIPLLAAGTTRSAIATLAASLTTAGLLVAGFGLDAAHLPPGCPVTPLAEYDEACRSVNLTPVARFSTWSATPFTVRAGYAVSVHRRD